VDDAAKEFMDAVLVSLDLGGIYSGPDDKVPIINQVERTRVWLTAEFKKRREMSVRLAKWYRSATTEKPTQWGPATLGVVEDIVRQAHQAFGEENTKSWHRTVKTQQRSEYYAGLLCIETELLPAAKSENQQLIAERVRKRLKRGQALRQSPGLVLAK
jgi:hypothetical protein